jgi:hypothetical protein
MAMTRRLALVAENALLNGDLQRGAIGTGRSPGGERNGRQAPERS